MKKKIGIVGFGVVGKSALRFLATHEPNRHIFIWDKRDLDEQEHLLIKKYKGTFVKASLASFLSANDTNIVSPGIPFHLYDSFPHTSELDLFTQHFCKKTIAITGTLGKTTVTRMIEQQLPVPSMAAGNIGRPMLELIDHQDEIDYAILEISSFQAGQNKSFAPDVAVWTNFYHNHLDHHATIEEYLDAKWQLFAHQAPTQYGIFSRQLLQDSGFVERLRSYRGQAIFVPEGASGFESNVLLVQRLFKLLSFTPQAGYSGVQVEHRCERFACIDGVDFYNDSKATVVQATSAAIARLACNNRPIILVVGGQNKGVDRSGFLKNILREPTIKKLFCLGDATSDLVGCDRYASLSELVRAIMQVASDGDQVLFSPSGASFDLFNNYKERGELFKKTVLELYGCR